MRFQSYSAEEFSLLSENNHLWDASKYFNLQHQLQLIWRRVLIKIKQQNYYFCLNLKHFYMNLMCKGHSWSDFLMFPSLMTYGRVSLINWIVDFCLENDVPFLKWIRSVLTTDYFANSTGNIIYKWTIIMDEWHQLVKKKSLSCIFKIESSCWRKKTLLDYEVISWHHDT